MAILKLFGVTLWNVPQISILSDSYQFSSAKYARRKLTLPRTSHIEQKQVKHT